MIEYRHGNLVNVTEGVIAHGCNAQGVMGSGVALAVKQRFPKAYLSYKHQIAYNIGLGDVDLVKINDKLFVANCITQLFYGRDPNVRYVSYAALGLCFADLREKLAKMNEDFVINIPRIGAGLGGGEWHIIAEIIEEAMPNHRIICWEL